MKVSNLSPSLRHIEIRVGPQPEDVVKVGYRPGALTLAIADELRALQFDPMADLRVAEVMLLPILESWDLQNDDGSELPVNEVTLKSLPIEFIGRVFNAVREDALPNPQIAVTLEDGSPQEARQDDSLNGTESSRQPSSME